MSTEPVNRLIEKYREGNTSTDEERVLRDDQTILSDDNKQWFGFIRRYRKQVPVGLENLILEKVESESRYTKRVLTGFTSAAAIIIIVFTSLLIRPQKSLEMSYAEKLSALVEARNMLSITDTDTEAKEIIYEDELLIIYIK